MKTFFFLVLAFCACTLHAQQFYTSGTAGNTVYTINHQFVTIKFKEGTSNSHRQSIASSPYFKPFNINKNNPDHSYAFVEVMDGATDAQLLQTVKSISENTSVAFASVMFNQDYGSVCAPTNKIFVKLNSPAQFANLQYFNESHFPGQQVSITPEKINPLLFSVQYPIKNTVELLALNNELYATGHYEYCEPNMVIITQKTSDDTYYDYQWSLNNTGTPEQYSGTAGADVDAVCAWDISQGAGSKVAVLDEGVDLFHPDLLDNLNPGYDAVFAGGGVFTDTHGGPQEFSNDAHGTNCAGIICAKADNGIGVSGIAPQSHVIPVRIAYENGFGGWTLEYDWVVDAISWAVDIAGADVLSNSYQLGAAPASIANAIEYAVTSGRGGLGSVFVGAAGNYDTPTLVFPGSNDNAIGVAATSMCDERKSTTSCDGENFWGSNYGTKLDVAAPGVKIPSTDISGPYGYSADDYDLTFNGTSSATPLVSGIVALIIATNPSITYTDARYILESTCEKVGGYAYADVVGHPSSTWVNELGYGRVNACSALQAVLENLDKPDLTDNITGISNDTVSPANNVTVSYNIQNIGNLAATSFENKFKLSTDCSEGDDQEVASFSTPTIDVAETIPYSNIITIPENTSEGHYSILLKTDNGLSVSEISEANNTACISIFVQCAFTPETEIAYYGFNADEDSTLIHSTSACAWAATPAAPDWITVINGVKTGSGYFSYTLSENTTPSDREFTFDLGNGSQFTIYQYNQSNAIQTNVTAFSIYPNPAASILTIQTHTNHAEYTIISMLGQVVAQGSINAYKQSVDIHALAAGVYTIKLENEGSTSSSKFIKE